jgi:hypothetical protein
LEAFEFIHLLFAFHCSHKSLWPVVVAVVAAGLSSSGQLCGSDEREMRDKRGEEWDGCLANGGVPGPLGLHIIGPDSIHPKLQTINLPSPASLPSSNAPNKLNFANFIPPPPNRGCPAPSGHNKHVEWGQPCREWAGPAGQAHFTAQRGHRGIAGKLALMALHKLAMEFRKFMGVEPRNWLVF